jgi:hypothetical protein
MHRGRLQRSTAYGGQVQNRVDENKQLDHREQDCLRRHMYERTDGMHSRCAEHERPHEMSECCAHSTSHTMCDQDVWLCRPAERLMQICIRLPLRAMIHTGCYDPGTFSLQHSSECVGNTGVRYEYCTQQRANADSIRALWRMDAAAGTDKLGLRSWHNSMG